MQHAWKRLVMLTKFQSENWREDNLGNRSAGEGRGGRAWFSRFGRGTGGGLVWTWGWTCGFHESSAVSCPGEWLSASQEGRTTPWLTPFFTREVRLYHGSRLTQVQPDGRCMCYTLLVPLVGHSAQFWSMKWISSFPFWRWNSSSTRAKWTTAASVYKQCGKFGTGWT
jgi:hypothetical protein